MFWPHYRKLKLSCLDLIIENWNIQGHRSFFIIIFFCLSCRTKYSQNFLFQSPHIISLHMQFLTQHFLRKDIYGLYIQTFSKELCCASLIYLSIIVSQSSTPPSTISSRLSKRLATSWTLVHASVRSTWFQTMFLLPNTHPSPGSPGKCQPILQTQITGSSSVMLSSHPYPFLNKNFWYWAWLKTKTKNLQYTEIKCHVSQGAHSLIDRQT